MEEQFVVGINCWPGEKAMAWWREFDASTVKRDFSLLAEYQFNVVRIFLLWEVSPLDDHVRERYFGLFQWDGSAKEAAKLVATLNRVIAQKEPRWDWIEIKPDEYYERPREHLERLCRRFKDRFPEV